MQTFGIIFNDNAGGVWMGEYANQTVNNFIRLTEFNEEYQDLSPTVFQFVVIEKTSNDHLTITNLQKYPIIKHSHFIDNETIHILVVKLLEDLRFPSMETDDVFRNFLSESGNLN